ncbi:MAG: hypothetical protein JO041_12225, partial [Acidobacteria bacterium]|nr:hypothetical protein [Acidobacteriota bacterium]
MNTERSDVLVFSAAVIAVTTVAVGCFPLFRITSNWAENSLMFIPGIVALALLFRRHQELWPVGWRLGHVS